MKNQQGNKKFGIPVVLKSGLVASINPKGIPESSWNYHHGETATGEKVNSLKSFEIGESLVLQNSTGQTFSVLKNEFAVAAAQILPGMGYDVNPASTSAIS